MCGIAGAWAEDSLGPRDGLSGVLDRALAHRGPDGHGSMATDNGRLLLVHRRLAIIDPSAGGAQPMITPDGRHVIVFNGEIYNHTELRLALEAEGERFSSSSDTEVLLRLVARRGPAALADVRGMFALAVWDARDRTLLVARDRFGIKPIYIARQPGRVAFASEVRALKEAGLTRARVDPAGIRAYLRWGSIPAPLTFLDDVEALAPGTWCRWSSGLTEQRGRFADVRVLWTDNGDSPVPDDQLASNVRAALHDTVRAHLVADVPVGVFLSGGIDSAAIVSTAAAHVRRLETFTVTLDETTHDEAPFAAMVAERFGTSHHVLRVRGTTVETEIGAILQSMDQPTHDGVNTYLIAGAVAAAGIKTVLSGAGGDELFGGYPSFRRIPRARTLRRIPAAMRAVAPHVMAPRRAEWRAEKLRHAVSHADSDFELYRAMRGWMMPTEITRVAGPALRDRESDGRLEELERGWAQGVASESIYGTVARLESTMYLRHQLLRDVDVMAMAHGLEVRVPFVDQHLVSSVWPALGRHPALLSRKRLLTESLDRPLPREIVERRKQGFTLPFERWMDGPLSGFVRDGMQQLATDGWITPAAPGAVLDTWRAGGCHWSRPWGLAVLGHFLRGAGR